MKGKKDIHRWLMLLLMVYFNDLLLQVKAMKVDGTLSNETEINELQSLTNDLSIDEEHSLNNNNFHGIDSNKPSKLDLDVSEIVYMDMNNNSTEIETQLDRTIEGEKKLCKNSMSISCIEKKLSGFIDDASRVETLNITDTVQIVKNTNKTSQYPDESLLEKVQRFAKNHVMRINIDKSLLGPKESRTFFGAFGLKKLLIPVIIGLQLVKTMLFALFLPSIIGSLGKIVGKGVSSFTQTSQGTGAQPEETFEFKDNSDLYSDDYMTRQPLGTLPASAMYDESMLVQTSAKPDSRLSYVNSRYSNPTFNDRYYTRTQMERQGLLKKQDFKVFHDIPTSSLLLTNYDPFYSPLLSRLDAVFFSLGHTTEGCREYAVCSMYQNPARFAPYSNLVSAQLSRELNELRRPSSDNPDVLRFFRYMKAAKDGQDGVNCKESYSQCDVPRDDPSLRQNQAMLATYQDIDKLVHARKL